MEILQTDLQTYWITLYYMYTNVYKYKWYIEYGNNIQYNEKVSRFYHKFRHGYRIVGNSF